MDRSSEPCPETGTGVPVGLELLAPVQLLVPVPGVLGCATSTGIAIVHIVAIYREHPNSARRAAPLWPCRRCAGERDSEGVEDLHPLCRGVA